MIPLQDGVPSGRLPVATLVLLTLTVVASGMLRLMETKVPLALAPFAHPELWTLAAAALTLWLFGDNVEARLGWRRYVLLYLSCSFTAVLLNAWMSAASDSVLTTVLSRSATLGGAAGVNAVLAAHLLLLPGARMLLLLPWPPLVHEAPAAVFALGWLTLLLGTHVLTPAMRGSRVSGTALAALAMSLLLGLTLTRLLRRRERWSRAGGESPTTSL